MAVIRQWPGRLPDLPNTLSGVALPPTFPDRSCRWCGRKNSAPYKECLALLPEPVTWCHWWCMQGQQHVEALWLSQEQPFLTSEHPSAAQGMSHGSQRQRSLTATVKFTCGKGPHSKGGKARGGWTPSSSSSSSSWLEDENRDFQCVSLISALTLELGEL